MAKKKVAIKKTKFDIYNTAWYTIYIHFVRRNVTMGVKCGKEKMVFRCDHPGCTKKTERKITVHRYDQETGNTYRYERKPRHPLPYWKKVLRQKFFLIGHRWPDEIKVFCREHYTEHGVEKYIPPHRERQIERYKEQRRDIFN